MFSGNLIGALGIGTIGIVLVATIWHYAAFLRNPENRRLARNVFDRDGKAESTKTAENAEPGTQEAKTLVERLDQSIASQHEVDPSRSRTQAQRLDAFNLEKTKS